MRVEAVGEMPKRASGAGPAAGDAAAGLAIKSFLAAIESDDSLFCVAQPLTGPSAEESSSGRVFSEDIVLEFRQAELKPAKESAFSFDGEIDRAFERSGISRKRFRRHFA